MDTGSLLCAPAQLLSFPVRYILYNLPKVEENKSVWEQITHYLET